MRFWIEDSQLRGRAFLRVFTAYLVDLGFWQDQKMIVNDSIFSTGWH